MYINEDIIISIFCYKYRLKKITYGENLLTDKILIKHIKMQNLSNYVLRIVRKILIW